MIAMLMGLLKPFLSTANDVARNRLLNKHTPLGVVLVISALVGFEKMSIPTANFIIGLLSRGNVSLWDIYLNIWILAGNLALLYIGYRGVKLIVRISDCYFEERILKRYSDKDKNNMSCIKH